MVSIFAWSESLYAFIYLVSCLKIFDPHLKDLGRKVLRLRCTFKYWICTIDSNGTSYKTKVRNVIECFLGSRSLILHLDLYD